MKIEIIKGAVTHNGTDYGIGKTLEVDDAKAERLIKLGYAKKAGEAKSEPKPEQKSGGAK